MDRSHIYHPITSATGDLLSYAKVTFVRPGTTDPVEVPLYKSRFGDEQFTNPAVFVPGTVDVWTDDPLRFDLVVDGDLGFSGVIAGLDANPNPTEVALAAVQQEITGSPPQPGQILTGPSWANPVLIAPHNHDGAMAGSTVLDPGSPSADDEINQTWVGYNTDTTAGDTTGASTLGANAKGTGAAALAIGLGASAGAHAVAAGEGSTAGTSGVSLGGAVVESGTGTVAFPALVSVGSYSKVTSNQVSLRQVQSDAASTKIGTTLAVPATPAGVTYPLWLLADAIVVGSFRAAGDVVVGGSATDLVGCYGSAGTAQPSVTGTGATGALDSLLTALAAYGLIVRL